MADITNVTQVGASVFRVNMTLTNTSSITDPIAYVSQPSVTQEILARAGLPDTLLFVAAHLTASRQVGPIYEYDLTITYDSTGATANAHTHDHNTLFFPLREAYRDGPVIDLDVNYGPIIISADDGSSDFFRVKKGTDDLFYIKGSGDIRLGGHIESFPDATFDIGTPDGGTLLRRPRDIWLSRDLYIGRDIVSDGGASFDEGVEAEFFSFISQTSNPDNDPSARLVYWNSLDNNLHSWDGTTDSVVGGSAAPTTGQYTCPATVQIQDAVFSSNPGEVDRADASSGNRVIGFVINKPFPLSCIVQFAGEVGGFAGALVPNSRYYLSLISGQITPNLGTLIGGSWAHMVGVSRDTNTLVTRFETPMQI